MVWEGPHFHAIATVYLSSLRCLQELEHPADTVQNGLEVGVV